VKVVIEIKNMDAGNDTRNRFLTGPDFFNVREYPTAEFASTSIRKHDDGSYEATGPLTMHGVTREVAVRINEYTEKQTERFGFRGGFECVFDVNRSDFGMDLFVNEKTETLGDPVRIIAAIEGVVQPEG
jgi:polyisoprenoid-binding protein YceI